TCSSHLRNLHSIVCPAIRHLLSFVGQRFDSACHAARSRPLSSFSLFPVEARLLVVQAPEPVAAYWKNWPLKIQSHSDRKDWQHQVDSRQSRSFQQPLPSEGACLAVPQQDGANLLPREALLIQTPHLVTPFQAPAANAKRRSALLQIAIAHTAA